MKRLFFKEGGIGTQSIPSGYKAIGLSDKTLSTVGTNSQIENYNTPQLLFYKSGLFSAEDLGNGNTISFGRIHNFDLNLLGGNYSSIGLEGFTFKSITLPKTLGENLTYLELSSHTLSPDTCKITLSDYPNLTMVKGQGTSLNNTKPYTYELTDSVIDMPRLKGMGFFSSKTSTPIKTGESLKIMVRDGNTIALGSNFLHSVEYDFSSFTYSSVYSDGSTEYDFTTLLFSQNVTSITFSNIGVYDYIDGGGSRLHFSFDWMPLTTSSIDNILSAIDGAFPNTVNNGYISCIGEISITGGVLQIGETYIIDTLFGSDDFTNVGFVETGSAFVATGTTPNDWSSGTEVYTFYGMPLDCDFYFDNVIPPDGTYCSSGVFLSITGGTISHAELITPNGESVDTGYVGYETVINGDNFYKEDELGRRIWSGVSGINDLIIKFNSVTRPSAPTNGELNANKVSLESKGWKVSVNKH